MRERAPAGQLRRAGASSSAGWSDAGMLPVEHTAWRAALERDAALQHAHARRRSQGIVHTPPPLARAVVQLADELLRERFALPAGVCDAAAHVVDPACGPGAFLAAVLARAQAQGRASVQLTGFDLDPDALQLAAALRAHAPESRLALQCADVLRDAQLIDCVRRCPGVAVLLGNPPWTSARRQHAQYAQALLQDFRADHVGAPLRERKLGVLSDAYVRFFRVCAEAARAASHGALVGLVTNASFLDGPVHRGMRAALLRWFDELFVLDLGGSALLARRACVRDDNVFGVRPAVAITWLCRYPGKRRVGAATLNYARLMGDKASKFGQLAQRSSLASGWRQLAPVPELLRFVPTRATSAQYARFWSLAECLPFHREGVQSNRDAVVVDSDAARLLERLHAFAAGRSQRQALAIAERRLAHYDPAQARARVRAALEHDPVGRLGVSVRALAYRPLDDRYFCPIAPLCHRPRPDLLEALAASQLALLSVRKDRGSSAWTHAAASVLPADNCFLSARSSCRARVFPSHTPDGSDNLNPRVRERLAPLLGAEVTVLQFQHYALGCMSAPSYQRSWDEELHQDYARIPVPTSADAFHAIAACGERLAALFVTPLASTRDSDTWPLAKRLQYRDLAIDAAAGQLRVRGEVIAETQPEVLALSIGHHRPLAAFIAARRERTLDTRGLAALHQRIARLEQIAAARTELERVFLANVAD